MRRVLCLAAAAAASALAAYGAHWRIEPFAACGIDGASPGLSGVTHRDGGGFLAVSDRTACLAGLEVSFLDGDAPAVSCSAGQSVKVDGAKDLEGCAYDRLRGTVWVSDEKTCTIREVDLSGRPTGSAVAVPGQFAGFRKNRSLESLAMSAGGLEMWTANEEALECDGPASSPDDGTVVRIVKFVRRDAAWRCAGQWAYKTERLSEKANPTRSNCCGVSDLCAMPDGSLLALERELSGYEFRFRLYEIGFAGADDVSSKPSLAEGGFKPVSKELLHSETQRFSLMRPNARLGNYEGVCAGPPLGRGGIALLLVSDSGDGFSLPLAKALRATPVGGVCAGEGEPAKGGDVK